jgi:hypothetical protein
VVSGISHAHSFVLFRAGSGPSAGWPNCSLLHFFWMPIIPDILVRMNRWLIQKRRHTSINPNRSQPFSSGVVVNPIKAQRLQHPNKYKTSNPSTLRNTMFEAKIRKTRLLSRRLFHFSTLLAIAYSFSPAYSFSSNTLSGPSIGKIARNRLSTSRASPLLPPSNSKNGISTRDRLLSNVDGLHQASVNTYDPFETANKIEPQTKQLPQSMRFYAKFAIKHFQDRYIKRKTVKKIRGQRRSMWKKINEQRKNVMTLAGYTPHIVVPSFLFLFLGALMTSIVPAYYSKCIVCVATMSASRAQLISAIVGLGVTSTFAALFTGFRGSLFWIGGKSFVDRERRYGSSR